MQASLIDLARAGIPALVGLVAAVAAILCRRQAPGGGPGRRLATLGLGDYFGEMPVLTGAPRSATICAAGGVGLVILRTAALPPLLVADPTVRERLFKTLAHQQAERDDVLQRAAPTEYEGPGADRASQFLSLMRRFFGL